VGFEPQTTSRNRDFKLKNGFGFCLQGEFRTYDHAVLALHDLSAVQKLQLQADSTIKFWLISRQSIAGWNLRKGQIKLTSPGPLLYKQERVGKDGKTFTLYKFRTMVKDAEKKVGPVLAQQNDVRVTKIGRVLRNTRMDELPQLFNVLCGSHFIITYRQQIFKD